MSVRASGIELVWGRRPVRSVSRWEQPQGCGYPCSPACRMRLTRCRSSASVACLRPAQPRAPAGVRPRDRRCDVAHPLPETNPAGRRREHGAGWLERCGDGRSTAGPRVRVRTRRLPDPRHPRRVRPCSRCRRVLHGDEQRRPGARVACGRSGSARAHVLSAQRCQRRYQRRELDRSDGCGGVLSGQAGQCAIPGDTGKTTCTIRGRRSGPP